MSKTSAQGLRRRDWMIGSVFAASLLTAFVAGRVWPDPQEEREVQLSTDTSGRTVTRVARIPAIQRAAPEEMQQPAASPGEDEPPLEASIPTVDQAKPKAVPFSELQRQIQTEQRDPSLARDVEARLARSLQQDRDNGRYKGTVQLVRVDCGSKRCALEASVSDLMDAGALGDSLTQGVGLPRVRRYTVRHDDGSATVSLIAVREGYDLFGNERVLARVSDVSQTKK